MNWLDVVLLILIAVGAIAGYRFGLVQTAASFVAVIIGIALASRIGDKLTPLFELLTDDEKSQEVGGFILVLVVMVLLGMIASAMVMKGMEAIKLGWVNSVGGLVLVPLSAYLIQELDWRTTWMVLGIVVFALGFPLSLILLRNDPADMGLRPDGERATDSPAAPPPPS